MKEILLPKTIWGNKLPYESSKSAKKQRIKSYLIESFIFALGMSLLDIIAIFATKNNSVFGFTNNYVINFILTIILTAIILFIISFGIDYLIGETSVKKYQNKN